MRSLLDFLEEPYTAKCLEPLEQRINSSDVPADLKSDDPAIDPTTVEEARRLSAEIEETPQPTESSPAAAGEMEAAFGERVKYIAALDSTYHREKSRLESEIAELQRRLDDLCSRLRGQRSDLANEPSASLQQRKSG